MWLNHLVCASTRPSKGHARHQSYATHPLFLDNLHFDHFVKSANLKSRLKYFTKWSKWRLSKKKGCVAYDCPTRGFVFSNLCLGTALGQKHHEMRFAHRPVRFLVGVRYWFLKLSARKITRCGSHIYQSRATPPHVLENLPLGRTFRPLFLPAWMVNDFVETFAPMGEIV